MSGRYAATTEVAPEQSRAEIERILERYGADSFGYFWDKPSNQVVIVFRMQERHVRFRIPMPDPNDPSFQITPAKKAQRSPESQRKVYEQAVRQRWRALKLVIQARLESIDAGIDTFESAFLSQIMLPDGRTYGEYAVPQVREVYRTAQMPALLPGLGPADVKALEQGAGS